MSFDVSALLEAGQVGAAAVLGIKQPVDVRERIDEVRRPEDDGQVPRLIWLSEPAEVRGARSELGERLDLDVEPDLLQIFLRRTVRSRARGRNSGKYMIALPPRRFPAASALAWDRSLAKG